MSFYLILRDIVKTGINPICQKVHFYFIPIFLLEMIPLIEGMEYIGSMKKGFWNIPFRVILGKKVANIFWIKNMPGN